MLGELNDLFLVPKLLVCSLRNLLSQVFNRFNLMCGEVRERSGAYFGPQLECQRGQPQVEVLLARMTLVIARAIRALQTSLKIDKMELGIPQNGV